MTKELKPLHDRVIVLPEAVKEEKTEGGLIVPITHVGPRRASVIAVGPGEHFNGILVEPVVKVGDTVLYEASAGFTLSHEGENYLVLRETNIIVII